MNKIALIADIHGNREALKTALGDIKERHCDKIMCLGDIIAKGSFSNECVELIKQNCDVVLRGNCEDYFTKDITDLNELEKKRAQELKKELTLENKVYLSNLPFCYEFYLSGRLVRLLHAGPDSVYNYSNTNVYADIHQKYQMFEPNALTLSDCVADIVVYGHMHMPLLNKMYNRTLVCCGSVGNSLDYLRDENKDGNVLNTTCVNYVIMEGIFNSKEYASLTIDFIQIPYPVDKEIKDSKNNMESEFLYDELKHGKYRDSKKIKHLLVSHGMDVGDG